MREYDIIAPKTLSDFLAEVGTVNNVSGEVDLSVSFQFQLEWERRFLQMWDSLTAVEQDSIGPIQPPYKTTREVDI